MKSVIVNEVKSESSFFVTFTFGFVYLESLFPVLFDKPNE